MKSKTILVVGATGATGKHVVNQMLNLGHNVRVIARSKERMVSLLSNDLKDTKLLTVTESSILDVNEEDLIQNHVKGCDAVVQCLGHNMTMKGLFGKPRKLVADSAQHLCEAIEKSKPSSPIKFILMGSNGVANPDGTDNKRTFTERTMLAIIRALIPPHSDNEDAAKYVSNLGKENSAIEWVVVRPDDLIDGEVSKYTIFDKPQKGLFGANVSTRANVADMMCNLVLKDDLWGEWKFKMPGPVDKKEEQSKTTSKN
jgi:nucleoside-diphosphate-sugar epimerase